MKLCIESLMQEMKPVVKAKITGKSQIENRDERYLIALLRKF